MELTGKKINFLGGSITEGAGASSPETCYVADMHRLYNLAAARNYGIGGTRIAPQKEVSAEPVWDQDFLGRYAKMDDDADFVVVFGGTNDFGHGLAVYVDAIKQIAAAPVCLPGRRCFAFIRFGVYFLPGWFLRRYSSGLWPVKRRKLWEK